MSERSTSLATPLLVRFGWLVPLGFYLATVSRTPGWVDAPLIARTAYHLDLSTWVNHHNLFTLLGHAWLFVAPIADPHFALNVLCSVLGAATVYVVFRVGLLLTGHALPSALGALVLMVSHSLWWHSTMLEVYTLNTLLMSLTLLFVVRYDQAGRFGDLCAAVFLWGLACSNHIQMGLLVFGFAGLLLFEEVRRELASASRLVIVAGCFVLGFQIYLWVFAAQLAELLRSGRGVSVALSWMIENTTGGGFKRFMFPESLSLLDRFFWWTYYLGLFLYSLVPPWILFAPIGLFAWWKRTDLRISLVFFALVWAAQIIWSSNYMVWDMFAFSLPSYVLTAVPIIIGIDCVMQRSLRWRRLVYAASLTIAAVPWVYGAAAGWVASSERAVSYFSRLPQYAQVTAFWDPLEYFLNPNKRNYDRVSRYAAAILEELEPGACFWGNEATIFYPLKFYYQDVLNVREDVSYHLVFGMLGNRTGFSSDATALLTQLRDGCPVYLASVGYPERYVLDEVYARTSAQASAQSAARLEEEEFLGSFPGYAFETVDLHAAEGIRIHRLMNR